MSPKKFLMGSIVVSIIVAVCLALSACGSANATEPSSKALSANSKQAVEARFQYFHEAGCPVTLLVWFWFEGTAGSPLLFTNLDHDEIAGASPADSVTWRLNVFNDQTVGFTIEGSGDCRFNQPGACF